MKTKTTYRHYYDASILRPTNAIRIHSTIDGGSAKLTLWDKVRGVLMLVALAAFLGLTVLVLIALPSSRAPFLATFVPTLLFGLIIMRTR